METIDPAQLHGGAIPAELLADPYLREPRARRQISRTPIHYTSDSESEQSQHSADEDDPDRLIIEKILAWRDRIVPIEPISTIDESTAARATAEAPSTDLPATEAPATAAEAPSTDVPAIEAAAEAAPIDTPASEPAAAAPDTTAQVEIIEEFLVKWRNRSFLHCEWITEDQILMEGPAGKGKKMRFVATNPVKIDFDPAHPNNPAIAEIVDPRFLEVDRVLAAKNAEFDDNGKIVTKRMYLVRWCNQPYSDATWEVEEDVKDEAEIVAFYKRNTIPPRNQRRDPPHPPASQWVKYQTSPSYRNANQLRPYQLDGMNWLLSNWYNKRSAILADEMGLGKTVQSVVLLYHLKAYQKLRGPFLVAAPLSTLEQWKRTFEAWTDMNAVLYHAPVGGAGARQFIRDHEFVFRTDGVPPAIPGHTQVPAVQAAYSAAAASCVSEVAAIMQTQAVPRPPPLPMVGLPATTAAAVAAALHAQQAHMQSGAAPPQMMQAVPSMQASPASQRPMVAAATAQMQSPIARPPPTTAQTPVSTPQQQHVPTMQSPTMQVPPAQTAVQTPAPAGMQLPSSVPVTPPPTMQALPQVPTQRPAVPVQQQQQIQQQIQMHQHQQIQQQMQMQMQQQLQQQQMQMQQQQQQQAPAAPAQPQAPRPPPSLPAPGTGVVVPGIYKFDVLITSYEMVMRDTDLQQIPWRYVVIDEAHRLKSVKAKLLKTLLTMRVETKLLLTGTPLQNNTTELWSLLNFISPATFSNVKAFTAKFGTLASAEQVHQLHEVLKPVMLRRLKSDVEKSLPKKEETIIDVELTTLQKKYYRAIFERNRAFLSKGTSPANMPHLINVAMELRKCCNHPFLIPAVLEREAGDHYDLNKVVAASGKMVLIDKLLPKLRSENHRVLIFSQMTKMLDILEEYLHFRDYKYERLDGSQRGSVRQEAIDRFCAPDSDRFVFLLSTRAGGLGLNLSVADTVIIFDSDWNPQNDIQAQARCHRIGQTREVQVCRLVTGRTYESEMFARASKKLGLDQAVFNTFDRQMEPDKDEINQLLKLGAYGMLEDDGEAARQFQESDIDQILQSRARLVQYDEGSQTQLLSSLNVNKATFRPANSDAEVDISDPDFWNKVLGPTPLRSLEQLLDSEEIETSRTMRTDFMKQLRAFTQEVIAAKLNGSHDHEDEPACLELLTRVQHSDFFNERDRNTAFKLLDDVTQPRKRKRKTRVDLNSAPMDDDNAGNAPANNDDMDNDAADGDHVEEEEDVNAPPSPADTPRIDRSGRKRGRGGSPSYPTPRGKRVGSNVKAPRSGKRGEALSTGKRRRKVDDDEDAMDEDGGNWSQPAAAEAVADDEGYTPTASSRSARRSARPQRARKQSSIYAEGDSAEEEYTEPGAAAPARIPRIVVLPPQRPQQEVPVTDPVPMETDASIANAPVVDSVPASSDGAVNEQPQQ